MRPLRPSIRSSSSHAGQRRSRASSRGPRTRVRPDAPPRPPARALTGTARDLAWLYSPAPLRGVLAALLDIEREVGASLRPGLEHSVAHVRLAWWRDECERCAAARPAHPATQALL